jgi:hypothetical protein
MKISNLKMPAIVVLALGAVTSANAMPVPRAGGTASIVLVDCAYGWYRGPDGQCYPFGYGTQPEYYGNRGWHRGWYQGRHRGWDRDYYESYQVPYRRYPYYGQPYGYEEDDQ